LDFVLVKLIYFSYLRITGRRGRRLGGLEVTGHPDDAPRHLGGRDSDWQSACCRHVDPAAAISWS